GGPAQRRDEPRQEVPHPRPDAGRVGKPRRRAAWRLTRNRSRCKRAGVRIVSGGMRLAERFVSALLSHYAPGAVRSLLLFSRLTPACGGLDGVAPPQVSAPAALGEVFSPPENSASGQRKGVRNRKDNLSLRFLTPFAFRRNDRSARATHALA